MPSDPSFGNRPEHSSRGRVNWLRVLPFAGLHIACISVVWTGWSIAAVVTAVVVTYVRVFALTAFYHRYFSHKSFKTSRVFQLLGAFVGCAAAQRGPIWWSAHHRNHHRYADLPEDVHSPRQYGFLWSHMGWFFTRENFRTDRRVVKDWLRFPELRFLDRFDWLPPLLLAVSLFAFGEVVGRLQPAWHTNGGQMFVWGFLISTVLVYHVTYCINSVAHLFGSRRYATADDSRNNFVLALLTFGEGWHNNHHYYQRSTRQGFRWWEIDITWYLLVLLSWCGLVWGLHPAPARVPVADERSPVSGGNST
ncbi:MAG: acyl-CoA desaturase [Planctomycetes bacterium]|nr:acyl-CoA desaturase [Planctomycetota bacterium]